MELVDKKYPYPVLRPHGDDYISSCSFNLDGTFVNSDNKVKLDFTVQLTCDALRDLVEQAKVKIICHIECSLSAFRRVYEIPLDGKHIEIPEGDLSGKVFVCPFIVAYEDLKGFSSPYFNPIYGDLSFDIASGAVLAEGTQLKFFVEHETTALEYQPDIFSVLPYPDQPDDKNNNLMNVDVDGQKIRIFLPEHAFHQYQNLRRFGNSNEYLWSIIILPALVEALYEMRDIAIEDPEDLDSKLWSRILKEKIEKEYPNFIDDPKSLPIMGIAQELTKKATITALTTLAKVEEDEYES